MYYSPMNGVGPHAWREEQPLNGQVCLNFLSTTLLSGSPPLCFALLAALHQASLTFGFSLPHLPVPDAPPHAHTHSAQGS